MRGYFNNALFFLLLCTASILCLASCTSSKKYKASSKKERREAKRTPRTTSKAIPNRKVTPSTSNTKATSKLRNRLVKTAKKYQGSRYKYAGKTPKGFDCSGFTCYIMKKEGITLSPSSKAQSKQGKKIPLKKVLPGDLIFFSRDKSVGTIMHVALVVSNSKEGIVVIHSTSSKGVITQNITKSDYWRPKIFFARRVID